MDTRTHPPRTTTFRERWWVALLVALALAILAGAAPAMAAPPPTLGLDGLQAELTAHGTVDGYMRTTLSGTTPTDIPVRILAIVDGFYWGKLIMFDSSDPAITDNGGIAAGMSGSPIYVDVDGTDLIVGAVSYGDVFTLHGTGLATPIEYMTALQNQYASAGQQKAATVKLDRPVATSAGPVTRLVLGSRQAAASAPAGTSVMHPLVLAQITGPSVGTTAYASLAARLESAGITVVPGQGASASGPTPDLAPGSPCGVTFSTGLYALYVLGTVTYVDGNDVVLFGHPVFEGASGLPLGIGEIEGTLTGATVQGVWPSTYEPYKMMSPADAKGVATQDRPAGMLATLGGSISMFPVATHVTVDGGAPMDDLTELGQWFAVRYWPESLSEWSDEGSGITTSVADAGLYHGLGSDPLAGSAATTTTVVVGDGTQDYTFSRDNIWDNDTNTSWSGLADAAVGDVTTILAHVLDDPYSVRNVQVKSVDVTAAFATQRRHAGITDVGLTRALRWGENQVDVTYYRTGSNAPQVVHATLDIPDGTDLAGSLAAMSPETWDEYYGDYYSGDSAGPPLTLADTKALVDAIPGNGDVTVGFIPDSNSDDESDFSGPEAAAKSVAPIDWVVTGGVAKKTAVVALRGTRSVDYQGMLRVSGYVRASRSIPVSIYCREVGRPDPTKPAAVVTADGSDGIAMFAAALPGHRHNVLVTAEVGALSDSTLPGADEILIKVRARTSLRVARHGGKLELTARVSPADATGDVRFQRQVHGRWLDCGTATLSGGVARIRIAPRGVAHVRARFSGGTTNAASTWTTRAVK